MPALTEIHAYSLNGTEGKSTVQKALSILRPHLPICLPVYRRLQFGRFFSDTTLLTNLSSLDGSPEGSTEWIIAFVDRTCRPETEVWWFGSWEAESNISQESENDIEEILTQLLRSIKALRVPESLHQDVLNAAAKQHNADDDVKDHAGVSRNDYSAHLLNANIILLGAIHEKSLPGLKRTGLIKNLTNGKHAMLVPNSTFVFDIDADVPSKPKDLPEGLRWGELKYEHFATVKARTQIPRQDKTLAVLPQLAIYEGEKPVAWTFVGLDGSLTTLHVEEEWRGKGLAKAITIKLFREKMGFLWEAGVKRMAHGYVIKGNEHSERLCRSVGGKSLWESYWIRVDLGLLS